MIPNEINMTGIGSDRGEDSEISRVFAKQQRCALELRASTATQRIAALKKLKAAINHYADEICAAGFADFSKPEPEARLTEVFPAISEVNHAIRDLRKWMKARKVRTPISMLGTSAEIRCEPKGVCLIIAPWNYPFNLAIGPLVSAIAAGNTAIIKPSEMTPNMSRLIARLIGETFAEEEVAVFEGDHRVAGELLELPFNHIFFTGSPAVGRIVMAAAANHLASVTLELGGKSPVIVDQSADIKKAARDIMWGKLANNGQTCIAPDHLYIHASVQEAFLGEAARAVRKSYGATAEEQMASPDYCRIVNSRHFQRISKLYQDAIEKGASTFLGGQSDEQQNYFAPTILTDIPPNADLMTEEIFGPLLPVIPFTDIHKVSEQINQQPKPLALYIYARDKARTEELLKRTSAGGSCVNHNMLQFMHEKLPFGGVNNSGIGKSHGEYGFKAFSNERAVLTDRFSTMHQLYPPYTPRVKKLIDLVVKHLG